MRTRTVLFTVFLLLLQSMFLGIGAGAIRYGKDTTLASTSDGKYDGEAAGDWAGFEVAMAGDINGDSMDDILIGAPNFKVDLNVKGKVYVLFGKESGWTSGGNLGLSSASFVGLPDDSFGRAFAGVGDVNGDGFDDIVFGSKNNDEKGANAGKAYLFLGRSGGWSSDMEIETVADAEIVGNKSNDNFGYSVSGAGDVNGDGYFDFLVGATGNDDGGPNNGIEYLFLGAASGWSSEWTTADADASYMGQGSGDMVGMRSACAGDLNADGLDDFILGTGHNGENGNMAGKTYIIFGKTSGWKRWVGLKDADASFVGEAPSNFAGATLDGVGDVNGDKLDDILIGAQLNDGNGTDSGRAYLVFGKISGWKNGVNLSKADVIFTGEAPGTNTGAGISKAGDVNGDGYDDMLIGSSKFGNNKGKTYLILGKSKDWPKYFNVSNAETSFIGNNADDFSGTGISGGDDVNFDGMDDIIIAAYKEGTNEEGKVYILFPDKDPGPSAITTLGLYKDKSMNEPLGGTAKVYQRIYVKAICSGGSAAKQEIVLIHVLSDPDSVGFMLKLTETGLNTNTYLGMFSVWTRSHPDNKWIMGEDGDQVYIDGPGLASMLSFQVDGQTLRMIPFVGDGWADEDSLYRMTYTTVGAPLLWWDFKSNADFLEWSGTNRSIYGTPDNGDVGSYWVQLKATNSITDYDIQNYTLVVRNRFPEIVSRGLKDAVEDSPYLEELNGTDELEGNTRWVIYSNISNLSYNATSGNLSWDSPTNDDVGVHWVNATLDDGNGGKVWNNFTLTVRNVNDAPVITTEDDEVAVEDEEYMVQYDALDIDRGDLVTWSLMSNATWLDLDGTTAVLNGTPGNDDVGWYWVNVTVMDQAGDSDSHNFSLTVVNVNDPPEITSTPVTEATALYEYKYKVLASDVDADEVLTFDLPTSPMNMSIDQVTGLITWTPAKEQEGANPVTVSVSDGNETTTQTFIIDVVVPPTFPPYSILTSPPNGSIVNVTNPQLAWDFEDPDSSVVFYDVYLGSDETAVSRLDVATRVAQATTKNVYIPAKTLDKGVTYYWTVIPFDGENTGSCNNGTWTFKVKVDAQTDKSPTSVLISPGDKTLVRELPVQLKWSGEDPDGQTVRYSLYLGLDMALVGSFDVGALVFEDRDAVDQVLKDLARGKTYYWTVIPFDGENYGSCLSGVWSFSIAATAVDNNPPTITSTPVTTVVAGQTFQYDVNATDHDVADKLTYSLAKRPAGMVIDVNTGLIVWGTSVADIGNHSVTVRVSDSKIFIEQVFVIEVLAPQIPNNPPKIISNPPGWATVGEYYYYEVNVDDLDVADILHFSLLEGPDGMTIDNGTGLLSWTPKKEHADNDYQVSIMVSDGRDVDFQNFSLGVLPKEDQPGRSWFEGTFPYLLLLIIIIVVASLAVASHQRRRRLREVAEAKEEAVAVAAAKEEAVEDFDVTDVFLVYNDGRLIRSSSTTAEVETDKDIMTSMLVAIQGWVKESFKTEGGLDSFSFGGRNVILAAGRYLILAVVVEGKEPSILRDEMQSIIHRIEGMYSGVVETWDGVGERFDGVDHYYWPLFELKSKVTIKEKKKVVKLRSGVEFYGGYVRLKLGVGNELDGAISDVVIDLEFDQKSLRLSHVEPEYPLKGSRIVLDDVKPGEKRSVAVYFDPLICQESSIEGTVTFKDHRGNESHAAMKKRPVDIVCPIFYTKENVNVAMLKRLLGDLRYDDSKVFYFSDMETMTRIYDLANEVVRKHDVKFVREFKEEEPLEAESWYYGEVRESKEMIVIRVALRSEKKVVEIYVASSNLASLTGLLSELGSKLGMAAAEHGLSDGKLEQESDDRLKSALEQTISLLDKYSDK